MNDYDQARQMAQVLLKSEQRPTREIIQKKVGLAMSTLRISESRDIQIDEDKLVRELETIFNIWIGTATILDNQEDHIPWLPDRRSKISWYFWNRYVRYLEEEKGWAPATINSIAQQTDEILERLEDPQRPGIWDTRGMVVGEVQSGKTGNYTGLICKAVDAGYKLIIVLTGLTDSLRSQTQIRLDESFLGFDSSRVYTASEENKNALVGVGMIPTEKAQYPFSGTTSAQKGDFNRKIVTQFGVVPGNVPILLVVKKNKSVLTNIFNWALAVRGEKDEKSGRRVVREVPLLVLDDEADSGSIDTNPLALDENGNLIEEHDPTTINALIRKLLHSFEQSAYVGYTATPFANIFIHPQVTNANYGDDLFPQSFIINLPTPSNYIGASKVFGLDADPTISLDEIERLPIIRSIDDEKEWMPDKHKKDHNPGEFPWSLKEAITAFILSCAVRMARGQEKEHNSMLIHVTLFTDVQEKVTDQVQEYLTYLRRRLEYGDGNTSSVLKDFEQLWEKDFKPTSKSIADSEPKLVPLDEVDSISWEQISVLLYHAASKIQVKKINGTVRDVLEYEEYKKKGLGLNVIAIGGNKLSRGLTLEGLTVSYYLRTSKMYDTLMQMGRWFGYRPGYLDLCRLYTTDDLIERYEHIAIVNEELRQEFDRMAYEGATPDDFGLKVRTHPDNLIIVTATNKMRASTSISLSYSRSLSETTIFYKQENLNQKNFDVTQELLVNISAYSRTEKYNYIWEKVAYDKIINFLSDYKSHEKCQTANTSLLIEYIKPRLHLNELVSWTVILISKNKAKNSYPIAGHDIGLTKRTNVSKFLQEYRVSKSHLLSPPDEWLDLPKETREDILAESNDIRIKKGEKISPTPSPNVIRSKRPSTNGLLILYPLDPEEITNSKIPIIGFVISFPNSKITAEVEYRVNPTFLEQL
ncbi:Z1 domain-containing protein [Nostoc sp. CALU 546]|uniref:Z1 domain-containing protein n=1 Tax=Nostoc sp. CALU 546 TaxID=1867241 RepID=UPI003B682344